MIHDFIVNHFFIFRNARYFTSPFSFMRVDLVYCCTMCIVTGLDFIFVKWIVKIYLYWMVHFLLNFLLYREESDAN